MKNLLSVSDLNSEDIRSLISDAVDMKAEGWLSSLDRKTLALIFEKPSLRTRVSFEIAMQQLGGCTIYLSPGEVGFFAHSGGSQARYVIVMGPFL